MWHLEQRIDTSGGPVAVGRAGGGPPLVLLHGWPWSSYAWHRVIPPLSTRYTVHWYDMPGFGASDLAPPEPPSLALQGRVLGEVLAAWDLTAPCLVAHDFGGATSLRAHLLHGTDFAGLVLMNVVVMRPWGSTFFDHVRAHIDAFRGLPPHIHRALVEAYIGGALARPIPDEDRTALAAPWLDEAGQAAFYAQFALADEALTAEVEPAFGTLRCPTAILWGTDDPWIPLPRGRALAAATGAPLTELPGLGHLPQLEAPQDVAQRLTATLEGFA